MNIIANSKAGKSWLVNDLALSVATGRPWLGIFPTVQGHVLIIDNELHPETIAFRLREVAQYSGYDVDAEDRSITVLPLRGRLQNINQIERAFQDREVGEYALIIVDAFYRALPPETDENANADMAKVYNRVDALAASTGASTVLIHHASKGIQSDKAVTDVGSGAGTISRAADTHLILRRHQEDGVYVLDFALRSWPQREPVCIRWQYPLWQRADGLDASALWTGKKAKKEEPAKEEWNAWTFSQLCPEEPTPTATVLFKASRAELSEKKAKGLMGEAIQLGYLQESPNSGDKRVKLYMRMTPPTPPVGMRDIPTGEGNMLALIHKRRQEAGRRHSVIPYIKSTYV